MNATKKSLLILTILASLLYNDSIAFCKEDTDLINLNKSGIFIDSHGKATPVFKSKGNELCNITINIELKVGIPNEEALYITGNTPQLGSWDPAKVKIPVSSDGKATYALSVPYGEIIQFKLTRGSWQNQAIYKDDGQQPENIIVNADKSKTVNVTVLEWFDKRLVEDDPIKGTIRFLDLFECKDLTYKRGIFIWLPEGYADENGPYAVLYFHDAQNLFLPSKSFSGKDWKLDEVVMKLMNEKKIKPCIVVGIPNSPARDIELNLSTSEGKAYSNFIINEVMPFIKEKFPVSKKRENHIICGSSMGGLMSFQMAYKNPDKFGGALCMSSAFQRQLSNILDEVKMSLKQPLNTKFYIDVGDLELEGELNENLVSVYEEMHKIMLQVGFEEGKNLKAFKFKDATHTESAWANRLHIPLMFLLK